MDNSDFIAAINARRERAEAIFSGFGRHTLTTVATAAANANAHAIEYIEQAPVSVLIASAASGGLIKETQTISADFKIRRRISTLINNVIHDLPKLRVFLERLWVGGRKPLSDTLPPGLYQLRKIKGGAIRQAYFPAIELLAELPPSTLSQLIPRYVSKQEAWLRCISAFAVHTRRRTHVLNIPQPWIEMIARVAANQPFYSSYECEHLADFCVANTRTFNPIWSSHRLATEVELWTLNIDKNGPDSLSAVSYGPRFPDDVTHIAGFDVVPLRSLGQLIAESRSMAHCVATYWPDVVEGFSRIFSIRTKDRLRPHATFEIRLKQPNIRRNQVVDDPLWVLVQIRAFANRQPSSDVTKVVHSFITSCGQAVIGK